MFPDRVDFPASTARNYTSINTHRQHGGRGAVGGVSRKKRKQSRATAQGSEPSSTRGVIHVHETGDLVRENIGHDMREDIRL